MVAMEETSADVHMEPSVRSHFPLKTLIVLLVIIVGALIIGVFLFGRFGVASPGSTAGPAEVPHGLLFLSLAPASSASGARGGPSPAVYDLSRSDGIYLPANKLVGKGISFTEQYRFSPDGQWAVFVGESVLDNGTSTFGAPQVYRADVSKAPDLTTLVPALQSASAITNDTDYKRAPAISATGDVLYMSRPKNAPFIDTPETASIVYVPISGEAKALVQGSYPQWVDTNRLIFLKSDGIYMHSIDTGLSKRVWSMQSGVTASSMLRLSDDKTIIAWSIPQYGVVTFLRAKDWNTPRIQFIGTVPAVGQWPVIAHDSSALAILTLGSGTGATSNPGLEIAVYGVGSLKLISSIPIPPSDPDLTALTDWRQ